MSNGRDLCKWPVFLFRMHSKSNKYLKMFGLFVLPKSIRPTTIWSFNTILLLHIMPTISLEIFLMGHFYNAGLGIFMFSRLNTCGVLFVTFYEAKVYIEPVCSIQQQITNKRRSRQHFIRSSDGIQMALLMLFVLHDWKLVTD